MTTIAEWLQTQPKEVQDLIGPQVEALQNSLRAARDERDTALKAAKPSADVAELQTQLTSRDRRIAFLEEAGAKGVRDARLAWALAQSENAFTDAGKVDWSKLRDLSPTLFQAQLKTSAGSGTENPPKSQPKLQDAFRRGSHPQSV